MSAYLVNKEHLSFIITWAIDNGTLGGLSPQAWFVEFYDENIRSLQARYPSNYHELVYWNPNNTKYTPTFNALRHKKYSKEIAIAVFKLVSCWEYQSCEGEYDSSSLSWKMMAHIKNLAIEKAGYNTFYHKDHPIYDSFVYDLAPWEYSSQDWKEFILALKSDRSRAQKLK